MNKGAQQMNPTTAFMQAREQLLKHREDYAAAMAGFHWPKLERFNWAIDWFDELSRNNARPALRIVSETAGITEVTFAALADSSTRVARFFHDRGVRKGDRILVMLNNVLPLWETMLAAMKLGAVVIPATTQLTRDDLQDRLTRGNVRHAVVDAACVERLAEFAGALEL
jgi:acetyl-CoA synthetase